MISELAFGRLSAESLLAAWRLTATLLQPLDVLTLIEPSATSCATAAIPQFRATASLPRAGGSAGTLATSTQSGSG